MKSFNPAEVLENIDFQKLLKHPNILLAAKFWDEDRFEAATVCYKQLRMIDDMIDDKKASSDLFTDCEKQLFINRVNEWMDCLNGHSGNSPEIKKFIETVSRFNIPLKPFQVFARSMIYDIQKKGFPTFQTLLDYSEGASVAPASVFVHLCCLNQNRSGYVIPIQDIMDISRPCALFSYMVHIIRDFQKDQSENLNYFAEDILLKNGLTPDDLKQLAFNGQPGSDFRNVVRYYYEQAGYYKNQTEKMINHISPFLDYRYQLSLQVIFNLYKLVFERIDIERSNFTTNELNPSQSEIEMCVRITVEDFCPVITA